MFRFLARHNDVPALNGRDHFLRLPQAGDYKQWYRLRSQSRGFLQPWEPLWRSDDLTEAAFRQRVRRNAQEFSAGLAVPLLLFRREDEALLGGLTIGYIRRGAAQSCMIGYWIGEKHAGQGHMGGALSLAIPYIHDGLRLHRIEAACIPDNWKSIRLLESAGFEREGLLRQYLKINGEWRDHLMFSRLKGEEARGKTPQP